jgi:hypothetical protein
MSEHHHQHEHGQHHHPPRLTTQKIVFGVAVAGALIGMVIWMIARATPDNVVEGNAPKVQTPAK